MFKYAIVILAAVVFEVSAGRDIPVILSEDGRTCYVLLGAQMGGSNEVSRGLCSALRRYLLEFGREVGSLIMLRKSHTGGLTSREEPRPSK